MSVDFRGSAEFHFDFPLGMSQIQMRNSFGHCQKLVHVIGSGKHLPRDVPSGDSGFGNELDDFRLPLSDGVSKVRSLTFRSS